MLNRLTSISKSSEALVKDRYVRRKVLLKCASSLSCLVNCSTNAISVPPRSCGGSAFESYEISCS